MIQEAVNPATQDRVVLFFDQFRDRLLYNMNRRGPVEVPYRIRCSSKTFFEMAVKLLKEEMTWEDRLQCMPERRGAD